jgi:hypothetical protein
MSKKEKRFTLSELLIIAGPEARIEEITELEIQNPLFQIELSKKIPLFLSRNKIYRVQERHYLFLIEEIFKEKSILPLKDRKKYFFFLKKLGFSRIRGLQGILYLLKK